jgi:hypothetical protein
MGPRLSICVEGSAPVAWATMSNLCSKTRCQEAIDKLAGSGRFWVVAAYLIAMVALCSVAVAQSDKSTTINIVVVETHDRLTPTPKPDIVKRHEATVVLHVDKKIDETFTNADITNRPHDDPGGERTASLGENDGRTFWHVLGPNKLQRLWQNYDTLVMWTIKIGSDRSCSIDAKYLLKAGRRATAGKIAGTDVDATFNNYRVLKATCAIQ